MMGNFFRVTCPYLFELDTVDYFPPLIRGRHSFDAVARIRDTTQLLLDVCSAEKYVFLHPLKVWNRYSNRMFLPHCFDARIGEFSTVQDGVGTSWYYQVLQRMEAANQDQNYDSYDRFFHAARMEYAHDGNLNAEIESQLITSMMTRDDHLREIVSNDCWRLRIRQRTEAEYFSAAEELKQHLLTGVFPAKIREQFLTMLEYFGQSPIIVRSSSF